jgi:hypothetical protein
MRNIWFPKGAAEYMTRQRFTELGLSDAAIGVRDRTFGTQQVAEEEKATPRENAASDSKNKRKDVLTLPVSDIHHFNLLMPEGLGGKNNMSIKIR